MTLKNQKLKIGESWRILNILGGFFGGAVSQWIFCSVCFCSIAKKLLLVTEMEELLHLFTFFGFTSTCVTYFLKCFSDRVKLVECSSLWEGSLKTPITYLGLPGLFLLKNIAHC